MDAPGLNLSKLRNTLPGIDLASVPRIDELFLEMQLELRGLAQVAFADQAKNHTLQPTALINEAWLKLAGRTPAINDRHHFLALVARAMRQILTDHARAKGSAKRGGQRGKLTLVDEPADDLGKRIDCVDFNDALDRLESLNLRHAQVLEMRLLGTLTISEIADLLCVSETTVKRDWQAARLWLICELRDR